MRNTAISASSRPRSAFHAVATVVLGMLLFAGLWLGKDALSESLSTSTATSSSVSSVEPWPTLAPTVSAQPAPAGVVYPTPIPLPRWDDKAELVVGTFMLTSAQEAKVQDGNPSWRDKNTFLQLTYEVSYYVDLSGLGPTSIKRDGNTISVIIPRPKFKLPVHVGIESLEEKHHSELFPRGPEEQVIRKGVSDVVKQIENNPGLQKLAYEAAQLQVTKLLESLGFTRVTVTIAQ